MSARADSITAHRRRLTGSRFPADSSPVRIGSGHTDAPTVRPGHPRCRTGTSSQASSVLANSVLNQFSELRSERTDVLRLRALRALGDVELNLLVLVKRAVSAAGDGRVVREHVGAAVFGSNEAEALFSVEPLHGASCHNLFSSKSALSIPNAGSDRRGVRRPLQTGTKRTPGTRPQAFKTYDAQQLRDGDYPKRRKYLVL